MQGHLLGWARVGGGGGRVVSTAQHIAILNGLIRGGK